MRVVEELALQRKRYPHLTDEEWRFMLQQIEGRARTRDKLPTFATIENWWYPVRLSCEQCSSELTARHKAKLIGNAAEPPQVRGKRVFVDLTGGYGVDTYFISKLFDEVHYVERNEELCRIARHNFSTYRPHIQVHNTHAEKFLLENKAIGKNCTVFIDPARRDQNGGKVFRLEDCEPNVVTLLPTLRQARQIVLKLSPMLDITAALRSLQMEFDVHIVAVKNEVKEVLLVQSIDSTKIHATNLLPTASPVAYEQQDFVFTQEEERLACCAMYSHENAHLANIGGYVYEPNAAIIKAGAYKLVANRYGLCKMAPHTHLYIADHLVEGFPGRVWQIVETNVKSAKDIAANIMIRNYPLTPEQLRKKLKIKDNDAYTIIGARLGDKPTLLLCKKV